MIHDIMIKKVSAKLLQKHKIGDYVKLRVPDIDQLKFDQHSLPCKILQQKPGTTTNQRTKPVHCQCVTTNCSTLKCSCCKGGRLCTRECGCVRRRVCQN